MIRKIIFKGDYIFNEEEFAIEFKTGTNVIIGPKGGGKSTLFNLIVGFQNGYISKKVLEAFKEKTKIIPLRAILNSGEEIDIETLRKIPSKEFNGKVNKLHNVIWQDDEVKSKLDDNKVIIKEKKKFLEEILIENNSIRDLLTDLRNIHTKLREVKNTRDTKINWDNIFLINNIEDNYNPVLELAYNNFAYLNKLDHIKETNEKVNLSIKSLNIQYGTLGESNFSKDKIHDLSYKKNLKSAIDSNKIVFDSLFIRNIEIGKIKKALDSFDIALKICKDKIKANIKKEGVKKEFISTSKHYFRKTALLIMEIKIMYDKLIKKGITIEMGVEKKIDILNLKTDENHKLSEDMIINLLKEILYTPTSVNDLEKWINSQLIRDKMKEFKESSILKKMQRELTDCVHIMAGNQKYETLSNGQKSIFGIKFKMEYAKKESDILFLDQPEDNLDNLTIKNELVTEIEQFNGQKFVVTHNANIGILTDVSNVIVADFDSNEPYKIGKLKIALGDKSSHAADYLEGGFDSLDQRYNKISLKGGQ